MCSTYQTSVSSQVYADRAPTHVRNFLRMAFAGVYDGSEVRLYVDGALIDTTPATGSRTLNEDTPASWRRSASRRAWVLLPLPSPPSNDKNSDKTLS